MKAKPQYQTLPVTKDDGTIVHATRVALKDLETLTELQEKVLARYVEEDGGFGTLMADAAVIADLQAICSILPLVEKTKTGETQYLDFEDISDNWEQLIILFFNGGLDVATRVSERVMPSLISSLHFFPYLTMLQKIVKEVEALNQSGN